MRLLHNPNFGRLAAISLIVFTVALLIISGVKSYRLAALDSALFNNKLSVGCVERFSGSISFKNPVADAKLLVTLDYTIDDADAERSVLPTDHHYELSVRGQPKSDQTWTLHAYYFNKTGQLAETAQTFNNISCDQSTEANLEL